MADDELKLYQPSNGTEGMSFIESWCGKCEHERKVRELTDEGITPAQEDYCPILGNTMIYSTDHPGYPREWCYDDNGQPQCTAFQEELTYDEPHMNPPTPRCTRTEDMFSD